MEIKMKKTNKIAQLEHDFIEFLYESGEYGSFPTNLLLCYAYWGDWIKSHSVNLDDAIELFEFIKNNDNYVDNSKKIKYEYYKTIMNNYKMLKKDSDFV